MERRWKVIDDEHPHYYKGDILTLHHDDYTSVPAFMKRGDIDWHYMSTHRLVEIDEQGNTIRTYEKGDMLNEGTVIQSNTTIQERVDNMKKELAELEKLLHKPEPKKIIYDPIKIYGVSIYSAWYNSTKFVLLGYPDITGAMVWYDLKASVSRYTDPRTGQDAIDYIMSKGGKVHIFDTKEELLKWLLGD